MNDVDHRWLWNLTATDGNLPSMDHYIDRPSPNRFRTTRWSVIVAARNGAEGADEALAALCADYWYPLYAFVRRRGYDPATAEDLVQGFFTRLLEKRDLAAVDRRKGRFRSFLMASCAHYLANQARYHRAEKRGGGRPTITIDRLDGEGRYAREPLHSLTAERLFDRQWALTVLDRVLRRLQDEMEAAGKTRQFEALRTSLLGGDDRVPYAMLAPTLGLTEDAARAAATRLRRRYREWIREEVRDTLDDPAEVDDEIRALFQALAV
jgi:RNA polymerase sigma-70 factor (ECF subfamily)